MGMPTAANKWRRCARSGPGAAGPDAAKDRKQQDSADRGHDNRGHVEALLVPEAQKARKDEAAEKGADNADEEIGEQTVAPAGKRESECRPGNPTPLQPSDDVARS